MSGTVLLTGGTGFLGARVARKLLEAGFRVLVLAREDSALDRLARAGATAARVLRPALTADGIVDCVAEARPDAVVHVAAASRGGETPRDVARMVEANVTLPALLLAAMRAAGVANFVNTGTSWQVCDGDAYSPFNLYAATKQACEDLLAGFCADGMRAITLRLFDVYGPHDRRGKLVDLIADAASSGQVLAMSPGEQVIDLLHVDDVAEAFLVAVRRLLSGAVLGHEVYGVSGERLSLRALAARLGGVLGRDPPIAWGGRAYRPREVMLPWSGFRPLPGWAPGIPLSDGLRQVVEAAA